MWSWESDRPQQGVGYYQWLQRAPFTQGNHRPDHVRMLALGRGFGSGPPSRLADSRSSAGWLAGRTALPAGFGREREARAHGEGGLVRIDCAFVDALCFHTLNKSFFFFFFFFPNRSDKFMSFPPWPELRAEDLRLREQLNAGGTDSITSLLLRFLYHYQPKWILIIYIIFIGR